MNRHSTPMRRHHVEARGGGAHWAVGRPRVSADQAQWPTSLSFGWLIDMWTPSCWDECMPSFLLVHGCQVGPLIIVLAPDWLRGDCLGLLMCHCSWAASLSHVQLPSGPLWSLGLLVLGPGIYALDNMLVTCIFGPNSPAHIFRPASVEFVTMCLIRP